MPSLQNDAKFYDEYYFKHCCGAPYARTTEWLQLFAGIAEAIVRKIGPATVLDAGCAMGLLVEALRARGVEAFGIDVSEYAIARVRDDLKPFCRRVSVLEPLPQRYDLIVCIEVLEHLPAQDCERAVDNLCRVSDDLLFSSSPLDYREATHFNVQPPEYWAGLFALNGFVRDLDFDASFIAPWAMRFRRNSEPMYRMVQNFERTLWHLRQEIQDLRGLTVEMRDQLAALDQERPGRSNSQSDRSTAVRRTEATSQSQESSPIAATHQTKELKPVLLISQDTVAARMAGPGIRYYHLAQALSRELDVVLAVPDELPPSFNPSTFRIVQYRRSQWDSVEPWVRSACVAILPSDIASDLPQLAQCAIPLVIDGYDPLLAEWLAMAHPLAPDEKKARWAPRMCDLQQQFLLGDFFICGSERQRDWWLGLLAANGRVNPWMYAEDHSLRRLVDVVPYGLPETPPRHTHSVVKGVWQGIGESDRVILWGGGLWPWLDPLTAVRAIAQVWRQRQDIRLIFPGTAHPNPWMAGMPNQTLAAREIAQQLGVLDTAVFFGDWIPYDDWQTVLLESDLALTLHGVESLESRLAFRSRVLDYIWAGLPIIATRGDATSALIAEHGLGVMVDPQDEVQVAQAILHLLDTPRETIAARFEQIRPALTWERAVRPLLEFCRQPRHAPDKIALGDELGSPYYTTRIAALQAQVHAFENRRVVRFLNRLLDVRARLFQR